MKTAAVEKTYAGRFVLRCPALELPEGQITAVVGANGSGKTTLARVLAGVERADGRVRPLSCDRAGYLPQKPYAFRMSTERNVAAGGNDGPRARELMAALDLTPLAKQRAKRLSGGETAKMALARLLMGSYPLLILDEPTAAMDEESTLAAEALLRRRCEEEGSAILLITHSLSQVRRCADRLIFLREGRTVEQGSAEALLHAPETEELRRFLEFYRT